jgi:hypothetical protein
MSKEDLSLHRLKPHEPGSDERCRILRLLAILPGLRAEQIETQLSVIVQGGRAALRDALDALQRDGRILAVEANYGLGFRNNISENHQRIVSGRGALQ